MITCAHPTQLAGEKYIYNYLVSVMGDMPHVGAVNKYQFYRLDTTATPLKREIILEMSIPNGRTPYMHQFAHTPRYLVLMHFPLHWSIPGIMSSTTILPNMHWQTTNGTQVTVVEKASGTVLKTMWYADAVFDVDARAVWQTEEEGWVVVYRPETTLAREDRR
jgi:carotenoid cleavage dioxygenase-like enzyme